jgi:glycosyltransferase involved in cell wall biosynthesis
MTAPLISICIPAYRAERYLPETLASVAAQAFTDWELIVTEDGSSDATESLVQAFAKTVPQTVRYQRHAENRGLPATRNTGIAAARGEWIALLDSDDVWASCHLGDLIFCARRNPRAAFVHTGCLLFDSDTGKQLSVRAPTREIIDDYPRSLYLGHYVVQPSSVILKKELWARVRGFNPTFRYVEDREMWLRCARAGAIFAYTGHNTCRYRKHASALTTHAGPMALASAEVLQQHLDWEIAPARLRRALTAEAWTSAGRMVLRATPRTARGYFSRAWRVRPAPRAACYWLAACLLGFRR